MNARGGIAVNSFRYTRDSAGREMLVRDADETTIRPDYEGFPFYYTIRPGYRITTSDTLEAAINAANNLVPYPNSKPRDTLYRQWQALRNS